MSDAAWRAELQQRVVATFRADADERLARIADLVEGVVPPEDPAELLRQLHTLKGGAQAVGAADIAALAHRAEALVQARATGGSELAEDGRGVLGAILSAIGGRLGLAGYAPVDYEALAAVAASLDEAGVPAAGVAGGPGLFGSPTGEAAVASAPAPATVRVPLGRVDALIAAVDELHLQRAPVDATLERLRSVVAEASRVAARRAPSDPVVHLARELRRLRLELQGARRAEERAADEVRARARDVRLGPVGSITRPLRRVALDTAAATGKQIEVVISGAEVEVDRAVLDELGPVLHHLVRNAVDHGVEPPAARRAAGKPEAGLVGIEARADGVLVVEVRDDGAGVDVGAVREQALAAGALEPGAPDSEVLDALFLAGLSTSGEVSTVSGRGVGLDAVRDVVDALHGTIELETVPGVGTTFRLVLPHAHGVLRCLVARAGDVQVAVPSPGLAQLVRLDGPGAIGVASVPLAALFGFGGGADGHVALVLRGPEPVAVVVDEAGDEVELVVRPLPAPWRRLRYVAGVAVGPGGAPLLVLRVAELARGAARRIAVG